MSYLQDMTTPMEDNSFINNVNQSVNYNLQNNENFFDKVLNQVKKKNTLKKKKDKNKEDQEDIKNITLNIEKALVLSQADHQKASSRKESSRYLQNNVDKADKNNESFVERTEKEQIFKNDLQKIDELMKNQLSKKRELVDKSKNLREEIVNRPSDLHYSNKNYNQYSARYNQEADDFYDQVQTENNDDTNKYVKAQIKEFNDDFSNINNHNGFIKDNKHPLNIDFLDDQNVLEQAISKSKNNNPKGKKISDSNIIKIKEEKNRHPEWLRREMESQMEEIREHKNKSVMVAPNTSLKLNKGLKKKQQEKNDSFFDAQKTYLEEFQNEDEESGALDLLENASKVKEEVFVRQDKNKKKNNDDNFFSNLFKPFRCGID